MTPILQSVLNTLYYIPVTLQLRGLQLLPSFLSRRFVARSRVKQRCTLSECRYISSLYLVSISRSVAPSLGIPSRWAIPLTLGKQIAPIIAHFGCDVIEQMSSGCVPLLGTMRDRLSAPLANSKEWYAPTSDVAPACRHHNMVSAGGHVAFWWKIAR